MKTKFILLLVIIPLAAAAFPKPVGYVNDFANILANAPLLESELRAYERNTTIEIAVVTIEKLPEDQTLFSYGVELFQQWGIGKKGEDNGILVLIVKSGTVGNRMRIELGYSVQGYITGAEAGRILDAALPYYEQGDYQKTAETIITGFSGELVDYVPGDAGRNYSYGILRDIIIPNLIFLIFLCMILISFALRNRCPYCIRGKIRCSGDHCTCQRCKKKFTRRRRYAPVLVGGFSGGGGGGGFGGGGSGGGGAGR